MHEFLVFLTSLICGSIGLVLVLASTQKNSFDLVARIIVGVLGASLLFPATMHVLKYLYSF